MSLLQELQSGQEASFADNDREISDSAWILAFQNDFTF